MYFVPKLLFFPTIRKKLFLEKKQNLMKEAIEKNAFIPLKSIFNRHAWRKMPMVARGLVTFPIKNLYCLSTKH